LAGKLRIPASDCNLGDGRCREIAERDFQQGYSANFTRNSRYLPNRRRP
jgi:hypothetical protein